MRGEGIPVGGQRQPHTFSAGKTLKRCRSKRVTENVDIIDVDDNNVVLLDENYSYTNFVFVDDDDDDDVNSEDDNMDEVQFIPKNNFPVKLSKCKRTYSGKVTSNRFGLDTDSESGSSDEDSPDFEFEDSSGKLKEEWEKAFLRRQNEVFPADNLPGSSRFCTDSRQDLDSGKKPDRCNDDSDSLSLGSYEEVDRSPSTADDDGISGGSFKLKDDICNDHQSDMRDRAGASHSCTNNSGEVGIPYETNVNCLVEKQNEVFCSESRLVDTSNDSVFFNREMHKETDEYKRSREEELASRQRELETQAEEAKQMKRLLRRKREESMRLLDIERRQKLRVEEIREIQKKVEENLQLKEQLRAEVRKDLNRLETTCRDMASILRGLGIYVSGDSNANELRVGFRKALLKFHPDRASQSDIRQQVEAEEKFKLVSRMKDKFLLTS